jgi:hypothetical protein
MTGFSRRALRNIGAAEALSERDLPDQRAQGIANLTAVSADLMETLEQVFAGTQLLQDQRKVDLLLSAKRGVTDAWGKTRDAFLAIGRALNEVDRALTDDERDRLRAGFSRLFPFSDTVAAQFRVIARAVDSGAIPKSQLPGSYSTAYQMALLTPEQRAVAGQRGLLRPDVGRHVLIEFRKEVRAQTRAGVLRFELDNLVRRRRRTLAQLKVMDERIAQLEALLADPQNEDQKAG